MLQMPEFLNIFFHFLKLQYLFAGNHIKQRLPQVFISDVCYIEPGAQINELLHSKDLLVGG